VVIPSKPYLKIFNLFNFKKSISIDGYTFFSNGRDALFHACKGSNISKGDYLIVPSYICKTFLEPIMSEGIKIEFIDIDNNLKIPLCEFESAIKKNSKIKGVILVDYFGYQIDQSDLIKACKENNIISFLDYSHSVFAALSYKKKLKPDFIIMSARKTLPSLDGGILISSKRDTQKQIQHNSFNLYEIKFYLFKKIEQILQIFRVNLYSKNIDRLRTFIGKIEITNDNNNLNFKPITPSNVLINYIANPECLKELMTKHRENYILLEQSSKDLKKPFGQIINKDSYPQSFLILDESNKLKDFLRERSIGASYWPFNEIPDEVMQRELDFPNTMLFAKKIVHIPIHFSLNNKHIEKIKRTLSRFYEK